VPEPLHITSRDNPTLQLIRRLVADPGHYRKAGQAWLEGEHLIDAALRRGRRFEVLLYSATAWQRGGDWRAWSAHAGKVLVVDDTAWASLAGLESPAPAGALLAVDAGAPLDPHAHTVVLDRLQDAGNVGSILRSAAALGVRQVLALKGTASLWSPKVLRAGMGAHFALALHEGLAVDDLDALRVSLNGTSSHTRQTLSAGSVPAPCAWVFGNEGQGVREALLNRCAAQWRIPQPGGEESLNVAAAAAICLYVSSPPEAAS